MSLRNWEEIEMASLPTYISKVLHKQLRSNIILQKFDIEQLWFVFV